MSPVGFPGKKLSPEIPAQKYVVPFRQSLFFFTPFSEWPRKRAPAETISFVVFIDRCPRFLWSFMYKGRRYFVPRETGILPMISLVSAGEIRGDKERPRRQKRIPESTYFAGTRGIRSKRLLASFSGLLSTLHLHLVTPFGDVRSLFTLLACFSRAFDQIGETNENDKLCHFGELINSESKRPLREIG